MKSLFVTLALFLSLSAQASEIQSLDDLNPYAPDIEETLQELDADYIESTGKSPFLDEQDFFMACYQRTCPVFIDVNKATQSAELFVNGALVKSFKISSGTASRPTPNFDRNPNGRIYDRYSSSKYPGGDYNGLGNMPYAVFISGGFALHGTPKENWSKLGTRASHGCIRMHPDNARVFNQLVRQHGRMNTWITVR